MLGALPGLRLPHRPQEEEFVQSSIQFTVSGLGAEAFAGFLGRCRARGVHLKWFSAREAEGYTSVSGQWRYLADPHTRRRMGPATSSWMPWGPWRRAPALAGLPVRLA